jgi:hypothetical protein
MNGATMCDESAVMGFAGITDGEWEGGSNCDQVWDSAWRIIVKQASNRSSGGMKHSLNYRVVRVGWIHGRGWRTPEAYVANGGGISGGGGCSKDGTC